MERLTYSVNEVAQLLGLSRSKAYELVASGAIPVVALPGRRKLIPRATLQRLLDQTLVRWSSLRAQDRSSIRTGWGRPSIDSSELSVFDEFASTTFGIATRRT